MNILKDIYAETDADCVTLFYASIPYQTDPKYILKDPSAGSTRCEMFVTGQAKKWTLHSLGLTLKFDRPTKRFKAAPMLKLYFHPARIECQIEAFARIADRCGLSALKVIEYYSNMNSDLDLNSFLRKKPVE